MLCTTNKNQFKAMRQHIIKITINALINSVHSHSHTHTSRSTNMNHRQNTSFIIMVYTIHHLFPLPCGNVFNIRHFILSFHFVLFHSILVAFVRFFSSSLPMLLCSRRFHFYGLTNHTWKKDVKRHFFFYFLSSMFSIFVFSIQILSSILCCCSSVMCDVWRKSDKFHLKRWKQTREKVKKKTQTER